jgi:hypothetical protein
MVIVYHEELAGPFIAMLVLLSEVSIGFELCNSRRKRYPLFNFMSSRSQRLTIHVSVN